MAVETPLADPLEDLPPTARRIVETTRRLLIEQGYGYLSIENIANECELNKTAIRYYFQNKAGLMELVVDSWIYDNIRHLESLFAIPSEPLLGNPDSVRAFMLAKLEMIKDTETYLAFFELLPASLRDRRNSGRIEELYEWSAGAYEQLFASSLPGMDAEEIRTFSRLLFAVVDGLGAQRVISCDRFPPDPPLDLFSEILMAWMRSRQTQGA